MSDAYLLVSNPPHAAEVNAAACAAVFGLAPGELRPKLNFGFPEIWLSAPGKSEADEKAAALTSAGAKVLVLSGRDFATFPPLNQVKAFELTPNGIIFKTELGLLELTAADRCLAVSCRPKDPGGAFNPNGFLAAAARGLILGHKLAAARSAAGGALGTAMATVAAHADNQARKEADHAREAKVEQAARRGVPEYLAFVDFYFYTGGTLQRVTLVEGTVDYRPLGAQMKITARDNTKVLLASAQERIPQMQVNARMENVLYKPTPIPGKVLHRVLEEVSPDLKDLDPYDIVSRLIMLSADPPFTTPATSATDVQPMPSAPIAPRPAPYVAGPSKPRPRSDPFAF